MADIQKKVEINVVVTNKTVTEATKEVDNLDKKVKTVNKGAGNSFRSMGKSAVNAFGAMKSASSGFFSAAKAGLATSGIGLIPIILGVIIGYWDDIKKGIESIFPPFKKIGAYIESFKNALSSLSTFSFSKIAEDMDRITELDTTFDKLSREIELAKARGEEVEEMEEEMLKNRLARYKEDSDEYKEAQFEMELFYARRIGRQRKEEEKLAEDRKKQQAEEEKALQDRANAEEKARQDRIKAYQDEVNKLRSIMQKSRDEIEDLLTTSSKEQLQIQMRREIESLKSLKLSETQKEEARILIRKKYEILADLQEKDRQKNAIALIAEFNKTIAEMEDETGIVAIKNRYKAEQDLLKQKLDTELLTKAEYEEAKKLLDRKYELEEVQRKREIEKAKDDIMEEYRIAERDRLAKTEAEKYNNEMIDLENEKLAKIEELERLNASEEEKQAIIDHYNRLKADKELELEMEVQEAKKQMIAQGFEAAMNMAELFSGNNEKMAKKAFLVQKALSLSQATMSGIEGVQNAYKTAQGSPITAVMPVYPALQAGYAGVFSAMQIASIAKQKFKSSSGGGSPSSPGGGGSVAATPNFNMVGQSSDSVLAETVAGASNQTVQAYVLLDDLEDRQAQRDEQNDYSTF